MREIYLHCPPSWSGSQGQRTEASRIFYLMILVVTKEISPNQRKIVNEKGCERKRPWYIFKELSQNLPRGSEENYEEPLSGLLVS
jgi:hypothetical protein